MDTLGTGSFGTVNIICNTLNIVILIHDIIVMASIYIYQGCCNCTNGRGKKDNIYNIWTIEASLLHILKYNNNLIIIILCIVMC